MYTGDGGVAISTSIDVTVDAQTAPRDTVGVGAAVFAAPALLGLLVAAFLLGNLVGWDPLWPTGTVTLSEAVALRDSATALDLIGRQHDPNASYPVRDGLLKSDVVHVTPLEAAVSTRETAVVQLLIDHGATLDDATRLRLTCFARQERAEAVEALFVAGLRQPVNCAGVALPW